MTMNSPTATAIDPAYIAEIVRRVLARVRSGEAMVSAQVPITKLVTTETVLAAAASQQPIVVSAKSVVTPSAREEAKRLGIRIEIGSPRTTTSVKATAHASLGMIDTTATSWAESVIAGLSRRGIAAIAGYAAKQIVLTDEPAKQTYQYSSTGNHRAAMLCELGQVARFQRELSPSVWVIDKTRMNLPTIVNAVAAIARFSDEMPLTLSPETGARGQRVDGASS